MSNFDVSRVNNEQREAITSKASRNLVLAGAGSGKTTTLTGRACYLLQNGVSPDSIMMLTFTNKAANEMNERIARVSGYNRIPFSGTFHSVFNKILRKHSELINLDHRYNIADSDDQSSIVIRILKEHRTDLKDKSAPKNHTLARKILGGISKAKEKQLRSQDSQTFVDNAEQLENGVIGTHGITWQKCYELYEKELTDQNLIDFDDILLYTYELLVKEHDLCMQYGKKFEHILIDEFQDTNELQWKVIGLLNSKNLFVVGDDDQSIYGWRGAKIEIILGFKDVFPDAKITILDQNYRSTDKIIALSNHIISQNEERHAKSLIANKDSENTPTLFEAVSSKSEADYVARSIEDLMVRDVKGKDVAVLYRNGFLSREIERALTSRHIQYKISGGVGFWNRAEIKDVLSYLMLADNNINKVAFQRSVSTPTRGVGAKTIDKILLGSNGTCITSTIQRLIQEKAIKGKAVSALNEYCLIVDNIRKILSNNEGVDHAIRYILDSTQIEDYYRAVDESKAEERILNIRELFEYSQTIKSENITLRDFLEQATLQGEKSGKNETEDTVSLMTIHASKGLEFKHVFIIGAERGIMPSEFGGQEPTRSKLEEERRLLYVAITRAMDYVTISFSNFRNGRPASLSTMVQGIGQSLLKRKVEEREYFYDY